LVKLFGNTADYEAAMELALRTAYGFFPVSELPPPPPVPTRLFVPELLSPSLIILFAIPPEFVVYLLSLLYPLELFEDEVVLEVLLLLGGPRMFSSGWIIASNLNCSML